MYRDGFRDAVMLPRSCAWNCITLLLFLVACLEMCVCFCSIMCLSLVTDNDAFKIIVIMMIYNDKKIIRFTKLRKVLRKVIGVNF